MFPWSIFDRTEIFEYIARTRQLNNQTLFGLANGFVANIRYV